MGRRKIDIEPLTDDRNKTVTFVKRKGGLFKKAYELAVLCNVEIAVIIVGTNDKIHEFSSVDSNQVIEAYKRKVRLREKIESKSLATYNVYKNKHHIHEPLTRISDGKQFPTHNSTGIDSHQEDDDDIDVDDEDEDDEDNEEEDTDYKSKPTKRQRTSNARSSQPISNSNSNSNSNSKSNSNHSIQVTQPSTFNRSNIFSSNYRNSDDKSSPSSIGSGNMPHDGKHHKRDDSTTSQRPILRVQIPHDYSSAASNDSARTITALDTHLQSKSANDSNNLTSDSSNNTNNNENINNNNTHSGNPIPNNAGILHHNSNYAHSNFSNGVGLPNINTGSKYPLFKSPDSKRPTLPLPIQSKSQTSSPASATAPSSFPIPSSGSSGAPQGSTNNINNNSNTATPYSPSYTLPTPTLNQILSQQQYANLTSQPQSQQQHMDNTKMRLPIYNNGNNGNTPGIITVPNTAISGPNVNGPPTAGGAGEQTPMLPSRFAEFLASPTILYPHQEWPSNGTGYTPTNTNMSFFGSGSGFSAGGNGVTQFPLPVNVGRMRMDSGSASGGGVGILPSPTTFMNDNHGPQFHTINNLTSNLPQSQSSTSQTSALGSMNNSNSSSNATSASGSSNNLGRTDSVNKSKGKEGKGKK
ncbi:transcription factor of the MADS box family [Scheffersomyces amazonensis]|uniref:transcription factor of the MADS box family n=1 Tax=Scheffersomyces amazonensis TaxID=1078765 RepID=UPI00315D8AC8